MVKRLISALAAFAIGISAAAVPALAEDAGAMEESKLIMLSSLDIVDSSLPSKITYDKFVSALMGYIYDKENKTVSAEDFAKGTGMQPAGGSYKGRNYITVRDALKFSVILLGYGTQSKDESSLLEIAAQQDLAKGLSGTYDSDLTNTDMIKILDNLLDAEPLSIDIRSGIKITYKRAKDETLLSMYRSIYYDKGIVTANNSTSIFKEAGVQAGDIEIDENILHSDVDYPQEILGKAVEFYVKEERGGEPRVLYVGEQSGKNTVISIDAKDIDKVSADLRRIDYYPDGTNSSKHIKLDAQPSVIFNGVFTGSYTEADLMPEMGSLTFLDNDNDGAYDIISIISYETMIVNSVNVPDKRILGKYEHDGSLSLLELGQYSDSDRLRIIKDGNETSLNQISADDVLSVARSKQSAEMCCTIYLSSKIVSAEIRATGTEDELETITTDKGEYKLLPSLSRELAYKNTKFVLGDSYYIYLDAFGNAAYYKAMPESNYCLLFKMWVDDGGEDVYAKYMTLDNEWFTAKVASKIKYNGASQNALSVCSVLGQEDPQVVILKTDGSGEIKTLETAKETSQYMEDRFTKTKSAKMGYMPGPKTFDNEIYMTSTTRMFVMPEKPTHNQDDYYVQDTLNRFEEHTYAYYTICAYDIDKYGFTELISTTMNVQTRSENAFIVTKKDYAMTDDGEVCMRITGCSSGFKDISFFTEKEELFKDIEPGDIIRMAVNPKGMIDSVEGPVSTLRGEFTRFNPSGYYDIAYMRGYIKDIDNAEGKIKIDCGAEKNFPISNSINYVSYDPKKKECELITRSELMPGDKVILRLRYWAVSEVIRLEDE